jgi:hypothetical protein
VIRTRRIFARDWEVRALLDGRKTVWRRPAIRPRGAAIDRSLLFGDWADSYILDPGNAEWLMREAPYRHGDLVSVRESHQFVDEIIDGVDRCDPVVVAYFADESVYRFDQSPPLRMAADPYIWFDGMRRCSSATMPAWAVRHPPLTVVSVRAERLHDADGIDEGFDTLGGFDDEIEALHWQWGIDNPRRPVASNPWTWRIEMELSRGA